MFCSGLVTWLFFLWLVTNAAIYSELNVLSIWRLVGSSVDIMSTVLASVLLKCESFCSTLFRRPIVLLMADCVRKLEQCVFYQISWLFHFFDEVHSFSKASVTTRRWDVFFKYWKVFFWNSLVQLARHASSFDSLPFCDCNHQSWLSASFEIV